MAPSLAMLINLKTQREGGEKGEKGKRGKKENFFGVGKTIIFPLLKAKRVRWRRKKKKKNEIQSPFATVYLKKKERKINPPRDRLIH